MYQSPFVPTPKSQDPWQLSRRVVVVQMAAVLMANFALSSKAGESFVIDGLPADAEYCGSGYDPLTDTFLFRYRHPSFAVVPENGVIPQHDVKLFVRHGFDFFDAT